MLEAVLVALVFVGLGATHVAAYRLGRAVGERSRRAHGENRDRVL
jgi:hypothetical protein